MKLFQYIVRPLGAFGLIIGRVTDNMFDQQQNRPKRDQNQHHSQQNQDHMIQIDDDIQQQQSQQSNQYEINNNHVVGRHSDQDRNQHHQQLVENSCQIQIMINQHQLNDENSTQQQQHHHQHQYLRQHQNQHQNQQTIDRNRLRMQSCNGNLESNNDHNIVFKQVPICEDQQNQQIQSSGPDLTREISRSSQRIIQEPSNRNNDIINNKNYNRTSLDINQTNYPSQNVVTQSNSISVSALQLASELCELSSTDLNFLSTDDSLNSSNDLGQASSEVASSTVRDLDNILSKFEADPRILLENPNQLLNCKYKPKLMERIFTYIRMSRIYFIVGAQ